MGETDNFKCLKMVLDLQYLSLSFSISSSFASKLLPTVMDQHCTPHTIALPAFVEAC